MVGCKLFCLRTYKSNYWELHRNIVKSYDVITQKGICKLMVSELPSCQLSLSFLTSTVQLKSTVPYLDDNIMMS